MCGIAGYFSETSFKREYLEKMSLRIRHRGPDGEGYTWFSANGCFPAAGPETQQNCTGDALPWLAKEEFPEEKQKYFGGFAHRRLAIVDLEAGGHQPMCSADRRYWITYNGEIYNHPEIRETLQKAGHTFRTRSDTEVILAAYLQWGPECLSRFNGMWAFAIYDAQEEQLFVSRDRFGVKPFYYYLKGATFIFASEQKALLENPEVQTGLNEAAVFDYFVFGQLEYQAEGFFKNILELPPAHYMLWDRRTGRIEQHRYFKLQYHQGHTEWDAQAFQESVVKTRALLEDAIRLRMRADVEVGTCLSGGLDSSAIASFMRKVSAPGQEIKSFTAVFPGNQFDESSWASQMAAYVKATPYSVSPTADELLRDLDDLTLCQDIPIWSTSTYAQFRVMKLVRDVGIKVVLDGQGGDEVFAGYGQHLYFSRKELPLSQKLRSYLSGSQLSFQMKQFLRYDLVYRMPPSIAAGIFSRYFPDLNLLNPKFYSRNRERFLDMRHGSDPNLNSRLAREMENTSLKSYLKCEDRCAMWFGVESRTPFADDHQLINYVFSLPQEYKINRGQSKYLLREAIRGLVPEAIRQRTDKLGYSTPNNNWIRELAPEMKGSFGESLEEILNIGQIDRDYEKAFCPQGDLDNGRIFKFFSFARWHAMFGNKLK